MSDTAPPDLYRLHIRPEGDPVAAFRYCLDEQVLGTGWGTTRWGDPDKRPATWPEYLDLAHEIWSDRQIGPVRALHDAEYGSLVWTRDPHGIYHLARLGGPWEYRDTDLNRTLDLNNVRPAEIVAVPGADAVVPGAVVRSFSGRGQAFRRVDDRSAAIYSERLFARLTGKGNADWSASAAEILDSFLDPFDVEDLVAAYLQAERGLIALPARTAVGKLAYEYTLRDPNDGQVFAVQVKTGNTPVPVHDLSDAERLRWIIFSPRRHYPDPLPAHVEAIDPEAIVSFMLARPNALPPVVSAWLAFANEA